VNDDAYDLAAILASGDPGALYSGLSVLVSTAVDGGRCAALASFGALALLLDPEIAGHARTSEATPWLAAEGRATFGRSLGELRDTALTIDNLTIWACAASAETMGLTAGQPLAGVMSTPRFLRATAGARMLHV
jgi:hypothetical protein